LPGDDAGNESNRPAGQNKGTTMTTIKTMVAALAGFSMLISGSAFAAKGASKAQSHHAADSKGVPGGQRPKGRSQQYKQQSANERQAMANGTKRQDLKEQQRQQRAKTAAKNKKTR
jgi:hypothetical protein